VVQRARWRGSAARQSVRHSALVLALAATLLIAPLGATAGILRLVHGVPTARLAAVTDGPPAATEGRFGAGVSESAGTVAASRPAVKAWLASGTVPGAGGPYAALSRTALADLHSLTQTGGGVLAASTANWHYVWPRDASFAAVAYARTGHRKDALAVLRYLQRVQASDGSFQARYLPTGSGPPDGRGIQDDDPGWVLWATQQLLAATPVADRAATASELGPLVTRSLSRLVRLTETPAGLPPPSPDYWEMPEIQLSLGIAAPTLIGLRAGADLTAGAVAGLADPGLAARAGAAADRLQAAVVGRWQPAGYDRYGRGAGPDAAVTFALPPYLPVALPGAAAVALQAQRELKTPSGGLTPGASWPHPDGVSWTPETALFALADAAEGDRTAADAWLTWLSAHRSLTGSLPEQVLPDGSAGPVAPLAWTDALVVLTLDQLDRANVGHASDVADAAAASAGAAHGG
jgi:glucoamylase